MPYHRVLLLFFLPVLLMTALLLGVSRTAQAEQTTLFVNRDATGNNDGSSWDNAFTSLQGALAVANANPASNYEIWVAKGIYTPGITRTASFSLTHNNVQLYGGFAATETLRTQRNWVANVTVLSGDIDGNDAADGNGIVANAATITGSNSYHVLYLDGVNHAPITGTTVIDGFTITAGNADNVGDLSGGGLYCVGNGSGNECSPTLRNVIFSGNQAYAGGGMYNYGADNGVSSPVLTDVIFSGNVATRYGGGIINEGGEGDSSPILTNVIIRGNRALEDGGGIYNVGKSSPTLINVVISGNRAESTGGGMYNDGKFGGNSRPTLINVTISGNYSFYQGGAMRNDGRFGGTSHPVIRNSIIVGNTALPVTSIHNDDATATISYSLTDECNPGGIWLNACGIDGGNNLTDAAAIFINPLHPATAPNTGGDLRLAAGSTAINAGDNEAINATGVTTDLAGNARIQSGVVDMGAFEFDLPDCPAASPIYVHAGAKGSNSGDSWSNALTNLQNGLVLAQRCAAVNEIWVASGVYTPGTARTTSFRVSAGVAIYGGFAATETLRTERDWVANVTVLSGDIEGNDGVDANGVVTHTANITGSNSYHVLWLDGMSGRPITGTTVIDGFTITAGKADGQFAPHGQGGGLYCAGSGSGKQCSPSLANLTFIGNSALFGAGMLNNGDNGMSSPTLTGVTFSGNSASFGAGMYNNGSNGGVSSPSLVNSVFRGNQATSNGGGIFNNGSNGGVSSPSLTDVTFSSNQADSSGGGIYNYGGTGVSSPSLSVVTFSGNQAGSSGGGIYNYGINGVSSPVLTNSIFSGNSATNSGGGIFNNGDNGMSSPTLTDVTFSGNSARFGGGMYNNGRNGGVSSPSLINSAFRGNQAAASGGGLYNDGSNGVSSPNLTGVTFSGNQATTFGGGIYNYGSTGVSSPNLSGVTFSGNQAGSSGGGVYNYGVNGVSSPVLTNSIFSGNSAINSGGGIFNNGSTGVSNPVLINITFSGNHAGNSGGMANLSSNPTISNTIFWNNRSSSGVSSMGSNAGIPTVAYSLIEGCNPGGVWASACGADGGNNRADADPLFVMPVDATTAPTTTGNLRLQAGSPALNVGDNAAIPAGVTTDLDGNPRIVNGVVDLGAYEASFTDTPIAGLSATSDGPTLLGQSTSFTATVSAGSNITYTWDFGDGVGTGSGVTASYTYTATGTYTATVTASNAAGNQQAQTVVTVWEERKLYLPSIQR
ncbi:MAG: PKD domain-containing protein [Caldilineaceae bacterium]|nr:PKD domain-containing protein [Caldilineaceae bacterium]